MDHDIRHLVEEALKLPHEARAALADTLMQSLDDSVDEDAREAWDAEISKRIREIDEGKVKPIPWSEVRRLLSS